MNTSQSWRDILKFGSTTFAGVLAVDQGFFAPQGTAAPALHSALEGAYENGE